MQRNLSIDTQDIFLHVQKDHPVIKEPPDETGHLVSDHILQYPWNQSYHKTVASL